MRESEAATVVLVHGAGSGAWCWKFVAEELDVRGINHVEVDLPTVGEGVDPSLDVHADAAHVRALLDTLDQPVVLCGNSYGGVVITEASAGHPRVARLVYLAAFMPDAEEELLGYMTGNCTPEFMTGLTFQEDGLVALDPEMVKKLALQQAPSEVADWAASQARPMAMGPGGPPTVTAVGWRGIPSTYVVCTEDQSILPDSQRQWAAERATDRVELPFDHCPQLSHPAETADLLAGLARS